MARMRTVFRLNPLDHPFQADGTGTDPLAGVKFRSPEAVQAQRWAALCRSSRKRPGRVAGFDRADRERDAVQDDGQFFVQVMRGRRGNGAGRIGFRNDIHTTL